MAGNTGTLRDTREMARRLALGCDFLKALLNEIAEEGRAGPENSPPAAADIKKTAARKPFLVGQSIVVPRHAGRGQYDLIPCEVVSDQGGDRVAVSGLVRYGGVTCVARDQIAAAKVPCTEGAENAEGT